MRPNINDLVDPGQRQLFLDFIIEQYIELRKDFHMGKENYSHKKMVKALSLLLKESIIGCGYYLKDFESDIAQSDPILWQAIQDYCPPLSNPEEEESTSVQNAPQVEDPYCPFERKWVIRCEHTGRT